MLYLCRVKPLRHYLRGFLIAAWAGDKIAEFSFPEISFYFPLRPWFFFVSPAYAGKSLARIWSASTSRDHPRMCGEKPTLRCPCLPYRGSPPRMRGKGIVNVFVSEKLRITPACAGKRAQYRLQRRCGWDHPRMCGEKVQKLRDDLVEQGSPPRMRGKVRQSRHGNCRSRITPACAGKSKSKALSMMDTWDHPRMCGEKTKKIP